VEIEGVHVRISTLCCNLTLFSVCTQDIAKPAVEIGTEEDIEVFDLNFLAAVRMVTAFSKLILNADRGAKIVNISSVAGVLQVPYLATYSAAKSALQAYSETLRLELSPFGYADI
jgi:short-subunit dehydrogenase